MRFFEHFIIFVPRFHREVHGLDEYTDNGANRAEARK